MKVAMSFHAFAAGRWQPATEDYIQALQDGEFTGPLTVGILGPADERALVRDTFAEAFPTCEMVESDWISRERGPWEQHTLHLIHDYVQRGGKGAVVYANTKDSSHREALLPPSREPRRRDSRRRKMRRFRVRLARRSRRTPRRRQRVRHRRLHLDGAR